MSKARDVFGTTELMEMILLRLPNKSLIGCKRTCKDFAATYDSSINVQRKLFMKSAPWPDLHDQQQQPGESAPLPDLEEQQQQPGESASDQPDSSPAMSRESGPRMHLNPLCFQDYTCLHMDSAHPDGLTGLSVDFKSYGLNTSHLTWESSCHKMLVCQPNVPITRGGVHIRFGTACHYDSDSIENSRSWHLMLIRYDHYPSLGDLLKSELYGFKSIEQVQRKAEMLEDLPVINLDRARGHTRLAGFPDGTRPHLEGVDLLDVHFNNEDRISRESAARGKVFGDEKLAEKILLHLSIEELLLANTTCKTIRKTIENTPSVKQKLFLAPVSWTGPSAIRFSQGVPTISSTHRSNFFLKPEQSNDDPKFYDVHLNPMLFSIEAIDRHRGQLILDPNLKHRIKLKGLASTWKWDEQSICLNMWISSPRVPGMEVALVTAPDENFKRGTSILLAGFGYRKATFGGALKAARDTFKAEWKANSQLYDDCAKYELRMIFPEGIRFWLDGKAVNDMVEDEEEEW